MKFLKYWLGYTLVFSSIVAFCYGFVVLLITVPYLGIFILCAIVAAGSAAWRIA
jgi:hypothetical protein